VASGARVLVPCPTSHGLPIWLLLSHVYNIKTKAFTWYSILNEPSQLKNYARRHVTICQTYPSRLRMSVTISVQISTSAYSRLRQDTPFNPENGRKKRRENGGHKQFSFWNCVYECAWRHRYRHVEVQPVQNPSSNPISDMGIIYSAFHNVLRDYKYS
jgi:hypothetical protein